MKLILATVSLAIPMLAASQPAVEKVSVRAVAHFDFDQATLRPSDREALLADVGKMQDVTWQTVSAVGHTDNVGSAKHNRQLAEKRAASVRDYLVSKGLDPAMISTDAKAAAAPAASNRTTQGRARNRRAVVEFIGVRGAAK